MSFLRRAFRNNWNRITTDGAGAGRRPDDKLDWRPAEGMFTLRELIRHIPEPNPISSLVLATRCRRATSNLSSASVEELCSRLQREPQRLVAEVAKLTREQLNEDIEAFGRNDASHRLAVGHDRARDSSSRPVILLLPAGRIEPPNLYA